MKVGKWSFMNQKTEKALQFIAAIMLSLLAVPLWSQHRAIVAGIFISLTLAVIKVTKKG